MPPALGNHRPPTGWTPPTEHAATAEPTPAAAPPDHYTPITSSAFKAPEVIEMALLAQKCGRNTIPVVEKYTELDLILEYAEKVGVRPRIGMRVKLAARGGGRWAPV